MCCARTNNAEAPCACWERDRSSADREEMSAQVPPTIETPKDKKSVRLVPKARKAPTKSVLAFGACAESRQAHFLALELLCQKSISHLRAQLPQLMSQSAATGPDPLPELRVALCEDTCRTFRAIREATSGLAHQVVLLDLEKSQPVDCPVGSQPKIHQTTCVQVRPPGDVSPLILVQAQPAA